MSMKLRNIALAFAFVLAALCVKSDESYAGYGSRWFGSYPSGYYCPPSVPGYSYGSNYGYVGTNYQPCRTQYSGSYSCPNYGSYSNAGYGSYSNAVYGAYAYPGRRHVRRYNRRVYRRQGRRHYRRH